jgi:PPOX class probable F420-dependent enzyme
VRLDDDACWDRLGRSGKGVLGTVHPARGVDAVPVVYVVHDGEVVLPIDTVKAKSGARLQRLRNIEADPRAVLLVDQHAADWSQLWWVRAHGLASEATPTAAQLERLAATFAAYTEPGSVTAVIRLAVTEIAGWSAR